MKKVTIGRKLITKKSILEKLMLAVWQDTLNGKCIKNVEQAIVLESIEQTIDHFVVEDEMNNGKTSYAIIFKAVYLSGNDFSDTKLLLSECSIDVNIDEILYNKTILTSIENGKDVRAKKNLSKFKTRAAIAGHFHIDTKTLYRYTNRYIKCFFEKLKKNKYPLNELIR